MKIKLIEPKLEDYWYEQKLDEDPNTMNYNAGYDVSYDGYHYDTGCIDFPEEKWKASYDKRVKNNKKFFFIKDEDKDEYAGYCNYHYVEDDKRYECGVVIEGSKRGLGYSKPALKLLCKKANSEGIDYLYDTFEKDRTTTVKVFQSVGFEVFKETTWKKFGKDVDGLIVRVDTRKVL